MFPRSVAQSAVLTLSSQTPVDSLVLILRCSPQLLHLRPNRLPGLQRLEQPGIRPSVRLAFSGLEELLLICPYSFMVLTPAENGYFIQQVALAAASFGVAQSDIMAVGMALDGL